MESLKYPKGWVKKGICHYGYLTQNTSLSIASGAPMPMFTNLIYSDSINISRVSDTQVKLLAGKKYQLISDGVYLASSVGVDIVLKFYDVTAGAYIGTPFYNSTGAMPTSDKWSRQSNAYAIIIPKVDTIIELRNVSSTTLTGIYLSSKVVIEEVEAYIMPVPKALDMMVGVNQTWQAPSKFVSTTYTNSTGKPIVVNVIATSTGAGTINANVGGMTVYGSGNATSGNNLYISFIVPIGTTYVINSGAYTLIGWWELR